MNNMEKAIALAEEKGLVRPRDLIAEGIPSVTLTRLVRAGHLRRAGRGLYMVADAPVTEHHALAEAAKRTPHGVICLLSALRFHELTTAEPFEVWMAIDPKARKPKSSYPPLRIVRFSGAAVAEGVEAHEVEGVTVRVTTPARTIADLFRYRNKLGTDLAVEALRDFRRMRKGTMDELWEAAKLRRVKTVIRPYLEALV